MSRISSNIPALIARSNLSKANSDLETRLQRLSTGMRINRGADDPAGLIISQRLGSEISGLQQAIKNTERASSVISTAEGGLNEVSELLNSIKGLVVEAANTGAISAEERRANQLQIDSAIDSITRISESTSFGGLKLLNGSLDYVLSGLRTSAITRARVFNANLTNKASYQVNVDVVQSAQTGRLYIPGTSGGAGWDGRLRSGARLEIAGPRGVRVVEFLRSSPLSAVVAGINAVKDATGVSALQAGGNNTSGIVVQSMGYGREEFVSLRDLNATGAPTTFKTYKLDDAAAVTTSSIAQRIAAGAFVATGRDSGRDVFALVNGALGAGRGLVVTLPDSTNLGLELTLSADLATRPSAAVTSFNITGGGALYQLGGSINQSQQINLGVPSIAASRLGGKLVNGVLQYLESIKSGGLNDLNSTNFQAASDIIASSIDEISVIRGRLGAMERNTLDTNVRSIQTAVENLTSSQSVIRDADFAEETSALTRSQILAQTGTSVLQLANQQSQSVLSLLQG